MRERAQLSGMNRPFGAQVIAKRPPILIERPPYSIFEAGPLAWKESATSASLTCIEQPLERIDRPHRRLGHLPSFLFPRRASAAGRPPVRRRDRGGRSMTNQNNF